MCLDKILSFIGSIERLPSFPKTLLIVSAISKTEYPLPAPILNEPLLSVSISLMKASKASSI